MTLWLGYRQLRGSLLRDGPCKTTEERKRKVMKWKEKWERRRQKAISQFQKFSLSKRGLAQNLSCKKTGLFAYQKSEFCLKLLFQYLPSLSINRKIWKDENLLRSGLQWYRSWHSNKMTPLSILLAAVFLDTGNSSCKIVHESVFLQQPPRCSWSLSKVYECSIFSKFLLM